MTLLELDDYFNSFLKKELFSSDISLNGIQIQNSQPDKKQIKKIAFAVDACTQTVEKAIQEKADVLFVHHGLFWGRCQTITGSFYSRISSFIKNDIALCAYHIPLDANNPYGNNYGLAAKLDLQDLEPFGQWKGMTLGVKGKLKSPLTINEISEKILRPGKTPFKLIQAGKEKNTTIGIISGGASEEVEDAISEKLDCYITGEFAHEQYHSAIENKINVVAGGHYETEIIGINLVKEKVSKELGLETVFIDIPTGL